MFIINVNFFLFLQELKYISNYLPNNVCKENIDHHDHENEKEHLHQHRDNFKEPGFVDTTVKDIIANISGIIF